MSPAFKSQVVRIGDIPLESLRDVQTETVEEKPLVLVVDDEQIVADTLAAVLEISGYRTLTAYDGETALRMVSERAPAMLVSDVAMPGMNGVQLAIALSRKCPNCRVLLFSGHAGPSDLAEARNAGYNFPLLSKPVAPKEMLRQIADSLQTSTTAKLRLVPSKNETAFLLQTA